MVHVVSLSVCGRYSMDVFDTFNRSKQKYWEESLSQWCFVHVDYPGIKCGSVLQAVVDWLYELEILQS